MCGESARTWSTSSRAGRSRSRRRSSGVILAAYVGSPSCSRNVGSGLGQHPIEQIGRDLRGALEHRAGVVVGLHRKRMLRRDRPGVELLHELDDRHACLGVARHQRPLDRRSAAPAWEERRMHVQPETLGEHRVGDDQPVRDGDDDRSAEIEARLQPLRLENRDPQALARQALPATARACGHVPARASGRVRTDTISCAPRAVRGRRRRTARSQRPRSAGSTRAEDGLRPEPRERRAPRLVVRAVDDQNAVEMVELVLYDARRGRLELELDGLAVRVDSLDRDRLRPLDGDEHVSQRQTALVVDLRVLGALVIIGLTSTRSSPSSTNTNSRRSTPTCVAASPTPLASCMSAVIRSTRRSRSSSKPSTSRAFMRSTVSPYWRIRESASSRRASRSSSCSSAAWSWSCTSSPWSWSA